MDWMVSQGLGFKACLLRLNGPSGLSLLCTDYKDLCTLHQTLRQVKLYILLYSKVRQLGGSLHASKL